jgi:arylsulfatase A-like enzyme
MLRKSWLSSWRRALRSLLAAGAAQAQTDNKPNILFIMGDDIGWEQPGIYHEGLGAGETPNIDRIGHEGAKYMESYAMQSCTSGRNAFVTGMYHDHSKTFRCGNGDQPSIGPA